jgi:hypothetical protein
MHETLTTTPEGRAFALARLKELRERHRWVTRHLPDALDEIDDVAATYAAMALNAGIPAEEIAGLLGREPDAERVAARQREGVTAHAPPPPSAGDPATDRTGPRHRRGRARVGPAHARGHERDVCPTRHRGRGDRQRRGAPPLPRRRPPARRRGRWTLNPSPGCMSADRGLLVPHADGPLLHQLLHQCDSHRWPLMVVEESFCLAGTLRPKRRNPAIDAGFRGSRSPDSNRGPAAYKAAALTRLSYSGA